MPDDQCLAVGERGVADVCDISRATVEPPQVLKLLDSGLRGRVAVNRERHLAPDFRFVEAAASKHGTNRCRVARVLEFFDRRAKRGARFILRQQHASVFHGRYFRLRLGAGGWVCGLFRVAAAAGGECDCADNPVSNNVSSISHLSSLMKVWTALR